MVAFLLKAKPAFDQISIRDILFTQINFQKVSR